MRKTVISFVVLTIMLFLIAFFCIQIAEYRPPSTTPTDTLRTTKPAVAPDTNILKQ